MPGTALAGGYGANACAAVDEDVLERMLRTTAAPILSS
jgi:hypothetical protein